jgi:hypothetical protein
LAMWLVLKRLCSEIRAFRFEASRCWFSTVLR